MEQDDMIEAVREKVRCYLQECYPDFVEFDNSSFTLQEGSATVSVTVRPWHETEIAVEFSSHLVSGATITPDVMKWLLEKNVELHFGGFGLLFDSTIVYSQTLPGCDLSRDEFELTARTVATIADHYDDELVTMAGGALSSAGTPDLTTEDAPAEESAAS